MVKAPLRATLFCTLLLACAASSPADTIVLKGGEKIEGTITYESDVEVVISVNITSSIKDDRAFSRSEIESISKISADAKEYELIKNYKPDSESHSIGGYDMLTSAIEQFLGKYPESQFATELKENLYLLRTEKTRASNGELKWNNRWFNVSEAQAVQYQYDAQKLYNQMRIRAGRGDLIGALNTFEELEQKFDGAVAFPDAVELALIIIPKATSEVDRLAPIFKRQQDQFKEGIDLVAEPEKTRLIAANNATIAAAEAAVSASERAGNKWRPMAPLSERANSAIKATASAEYPRLKSLPLDDMRMSIALNEKIEKSIAEGKLAEATAEIKRAQDLWKENQRLEPLYLQLKTIEERNAAKLEAEELAKKQKLAATPLPDDTEAQAKAKAQAEAAANKKKKN